MSDLNPGDWPAWPEGIPVTEPKGPHAVVYNRPHDWPLTVFDSMPDYDNRTPRDIPDGWEAFCPFCEAPVERSDTLVRWPRHPIATLGQLSAADHQPRKVGCVLSPCNHVVSLLAVVKIGADLSHLTPPDRQD